MTEPRTVGSLVERGVVTRRSVDEAELPVDSSDRLSPGPQRPALGPRSTRVRRPASFFVAHCVGLILGSVCVIGLVVAILIWHLDFSDSTSPSPSQSNPAISTPPGYTSQQLIFDDRFAGTSLDTTKWTTYLGAQGIVWNNHDTIPSPYSAPNVPGFGGEAAMFGPSQVSVDNGLTLTAQRNTNQYAKTYPWISGVVTTEGKVSLPSTGWYVQVKAKMSDMTAGMWPAIWFMPDTKTSTVPEIDLFEGGWRSANPNEIMHSDYGGSATQYSGYRDIVYDTGSDLSAGYHVYGIQYIPNVAVKYFLDGNLMFEQVESDKGGVVAGTYELLLELQVASQQTSNWHTVPTDTTESASMAIAEVKAYS